MADMSAGLGGKYLKSEVDIVEDDMKPATIRSIESEKMGNGDVCFVAYFHEDIAADGSNKGMVLNKGNLAKVIKWAGSNDTEDAVGVCVMIFMQETQKPDGSPVFGLRLAKGAAKSDAMEKAIQDAGEINF